MLEELRISDLGVIAQATVPCGPGLTVLTGETGAGKTMVLSALALLLGGRADAGLVRPGARRTVVEGRWRLAPDHPALAAVEEAGGELDDDGSLLVVRTVEAAGRSRAVVGGAGVPVALLARITGELVTVHGQADQQRLSRPTTARSLVDRYDDLGSLVAEHAAAYAELERVRAEAADLVARAAERSTEADGLRHGLGLVEALAPEAGEEARTAAEVARLTHAEALAAAARTAYAALAGDDDGEQADARSLLVAAGRAVADGAELDPSLAEPARRLAELALLTADVAGELAAYAEGLTPDPAALAAAHERTATLAAAVRRYVPGQDAAALLGWARQAAGRVATLDTDDDRRAELAAELERLEQVRAAAAQAITARRRAAATRLAATAEAELAGLAMAGAQLLVTCTPTPPGPAGEDQLAVELAAHPGAPPRPIGRAASGGELSRVMLALEVALAGADEVPTMVFDEVDAGVGGAAGVEVGRRLAALGRSHQVLVVTHLPQVAAFADQHVRVVKDATGEVTTSSVVRLDDADRRAELARMLGGLDRSAAALDTADELLGLARS